MMKQQKGISRRSFVAGMAGSSLMMGMGSLVTGCSALQPVTSEPIPIISDEPAIPATNERREIPFCCFIMTKSLRSRRS